MRLLRPQARVLEIGSGTGQHAVYFSRLMPGIFWQCSDLADQLPDLRARIELEGKGLLPGPLELDVRTDCWPPGPFDAVFTANTLHIMPWDHAPFLIRRSAEVLDAGGLLVIYGPFHDAGQHVSDSNRIFDHALQARDPAMGVRDALSVREIAGAAGLGAEADLLLPANNRILVFRKARAAPT